MSKRNRKNRRRSPSTGGMSGPRPAQYRRERGLGVAPEPACLHTESMPNLLVRDIPEDTHAELQRRAQSRGQSLQQYLVAELTSLAAQPSVEELFDRIGRRRGGRVGFRTAVEDLDAGRADR